jgi:hypothetical protein
MSASLSHRATSARPPSLLLGSSGPRAAASDAASRRRRCVVAAAAATTSSSSSPPPRALEAAARLAASRLAESRRPDPLFIDPFAELLARADGVGGGNGGGEIETETASQQQHQQQQQLLDAVATRYLDECLLNAASATSVTRMARGEDYRQVVLLGCDGGDCRPFRLPWPEGTVLFLVAPAEVHERAEALLEQQQQAAAVGTGGGGAAGSSPAAAAARVPRGCLLRRVDLDLGALHRSAAAAAPSASSGDNEAAEEQGSSSRPDATIFLDALARAGFRGDRLSVWGLQGLQGLLGAAAAGGEQQHQQQQPQPHAATLLSALLAEVSSAAAFHSLVAGELPGPMTAREASNLLAEAGLLASVEPPGGAGTREYGRVPPVVVKAEGEGERGEAEDAASSSSSSSWPRLLFSAQQLRPSLVQMGIYSEHVGAMEGSDEDFGTLHFS